MLKTGSAHYAPAIGGVEMIEAVLKDQKRILPCAAFLKGEYGEENIFVGVPCLLGGRGLEKVIEIPLNVEEQKQFKKSVGSVKQILVEMEDLLK